MRWYLVFWCMVNKHKWIHLGLNGVLYLKWLHEERIFFYVLNFQLLKCSIKKDPRTNWTEVSDNITHTTIEPSKFSSAFYQYETNFAEIRDRSRDIKFDLSKIWRLYTRSVPKVFDLPSYVRNRTFEWPLRGINVNFLVGSVFCFWFWSLLKTTERSHQRVFIKFCFELGKSCVKTNEMMQKAFGDEIMGKIQT